jgi:hypothetical protein
VPDGPSPTPRLVMVNPRANRSDLVPRRAGLPNAGPRHLGFKNAHRPTHTHLPKDNEEVNVHVMHLQVMLDATIMVDLVFDRDGEARGHELDH